MYVCARKYGIEALTCWGVNDDLNWFSNFKFGPTMVDKNGVPKEYAQRFLDEIKREQSIGFSEQQIGKATVNVPTIQKSEAQKQVTRDKQEIEQENIKD